MSRLQKTLVLIFALALAGQGCANLIKLGLEVGPHGRFGGDFICFWQAAQHLRAGDSHAIYDPITWQATAKSGHNLYWYVYPPFSLAGLWPLGRLAYNPAVLVWSLAPLPVYFAFLARLAKRSGLGSELGASGVNANMVQAYGVAAALAIPFLSANIFCGQTGAIIAILVFGAALCWTPRPILAGVFIGLLAVKPQFGLLIPFALLAARQWRTIASAAVTIVLLVGASAAWLGPSIWLDYAQVAGLFGRLIAQGYSGIDPLVLSPFVTLKAVGLPTPTAWMVQGVISLLALAVVVHVFWKPRGRKIQDGRGDLRLALLASGTLLATPYALTYDLPMILLALVPILARAWRTGWSGLGLAAVAAVAVAPFAQLTTMAAHIPFTVFAIGLTFAASLTLYAKENRQLSPSWGRIGLSVAPA
jgi:alpha-1,2-mannosyltransferase